MNDAELVVRLSGDIDLCLRSDLEALAGRLERYEGRVVVDLAEVQFADGTLAGFLAAAIRQGSDTVVAPTRLAREFLALYGLDHDAL